MRFLVIQNCEAEGIHLEVTAADAARWADAYADELAGFGKSKDQVVHECATREPEMRRLAALLAGNFARLVAGAATPSR